MTVVDFIKKLYDLPKDAKMVLNDGDYSEIEIKIFLLEKAPTVEKVFKLYMDLIGKGDLIPVHKMRIMGKYVKDIIFHNDHYKKYRFYEIVIEK